MASLLNTTAPEVASRTRLHGLDALRAGALLLGIVLHSFLPFIPGLPWLVTDSQTSALLGIPVYVIHLFRMTLFMLLAGYFGRMVLHRRGTGRYVRDRVIRILLPFLAFWPIAVLSLGILAVVNASVHGTPLPPAPPTSDNPLAAFNPGQLWFLVILMYCVMITVVVRSIAVALLGPEWSDRISAAIGRLVSAPGGLLIVAVPYAIALLLQGTVVGGIIAPTTVLPELPAMTAYLGAFLAGWTLRAAPDSLDRIARWWPAYLAVAVSLSAVGLIQSDPMSTTPLPVAAVITALAAWSWVFALLGLCVRFLHAERSWIRYLADASYWMYLVHLPLLVGFEILLVNLTWPIALKIAVTWVVVGSIMVVSYHLLVRSTPVGTWLNGRRYPFRLPGRR